VVLSRGCCIYSPSAPSQIKSPLAKLTQQL
jgi:hypothetical protein